MREFLGLLGGIGIIVLILHYGDPGARDPLMAKREVQKLHAEENGEIEIPAGSFSMGRDGEGDNGPLHPVRLARFMMDRTEVTCAAYARFCEETGHHLPFFWNRAGFRCGDDYPDHPVTGVSWQDARDYAQWAGKRLPTEAEWEYAARGGLAGQRYPHGNELSPAFGNYAGNEQDGTVPVASYEPNGYGLYDMMGNVCEWVIDRYSATYYGESEELCPAGPEHGRFRVIRGGGWKSGPGCVSVDHRNALPANWVDFNVGFRCVRDLPEDLSRSE